MSDISTLEKKVSDLTGSINNWNRLYLWALAFALLAGAFSFWAQRQAISRSRALVISSNELSKEKDRQLQSDLRDRDEKIVQANRELEKERKERVELEKAISPRLLIIKGISGGPNSDIAGLKAISGIDVQIFSAADTEALRAYAQVRFVVQSAGWNIVASGEGMAAEDGVTIEYGKSNEAMAAANALSDLIKSKDWEEIHVRPAETALRNDKTIQVTIGVRPILHFLPMEMQDALRRSNEARKQPKVEQ